MTLAIHPAAYRWLLQLHLRPTVPSGGETFVEVHDDVYKFDASRLRSAMSELKRCGLAAGVERRGLEASLAGSRGLPVRIPRERRAADSEVRGTAASPAL